MNSEIQPVRELTNAMHRLIRVHEDEGRNQRLMHEDSALFRLLTPEELSELLLTLQNYQQLLSSEIALREFMKFKLQRQLVFTMQKVHTSHQDRSVSALAEQCRWQAASMLLALLGQEQAADACCKDLFFLDWLTHVIADFPYEEERTLFSEMLLKLSFSEFFPHDIKTRFRQKSPLERETRYIVRDMVYGQLTQLMEKKHRTEAWRATNPSRREESFLEQYPPLLEILLNRSDTLAGFNLLADCKAYYELDVAWGVLQFQLAQRSVKVAHLLRTLNLCHNLLINPDYAPPLQATDAVLKTINLAVNCNEFVFMAAAQLLPLLTLTEDARNSVLLQVCERLTRPKVKAVLPRKPVVMDQSSAMQRDSVKTAQAWNSVCVQRRLPEECYVIRPPRHSKAQGKLIAAVEELDNSLYRGRRLYFQVPSKCGNCELFADYFTQEQPLFWRRLHESVSDSDEIDCQVAKDGFQTSENFKMTLVQMIVDLTADQPMSANFTAVSLLCECLSDSKFDPFCTKVHCGLALLWEFWLEYDRAATHSALALGFLYYVDAQINAFVNSFSPGTSDYGAVWNRAQQFFVPTTVNFPVIEDDEMDKFGLGELHWRLHLGSHLLKCLNALLRHAPSTAKSFLVQQGKHFVHSVFEMTTVLAKIAKSETSFPPFRSRTSPSTWRQIVSLSHDTLATLSYVTFGFARLYPAVQFHLARQLAADSDLAIEYASALLAQPGILATYAQSSTLYLLVAKSRNMAVRESLQDSIETFIAVLLNMPREVPSLEGPKLMVEQIQRKIEFLAFFKLGYFLCVLLETLLARSPATVRTMSIEKLQPVWDLAVDFVEKAGNHLHKKTERSNSYNYPHSFTKDEIKLLPGTAFFLVVDFEDEAEDALFTQVLTAVATFAWITSRTTEQATALTQHDLSGYLLESATIVDLSDPNLCTVIAGLARHLTRQHPEFALSQRPELVEVISRQFIELHCPLEAYFMLIDTLRSLYYATSEPRMLARLRRMIGPLRSFLASGEPQPRYFNYPNLQQIQEKKVGVLLVSDLQCEGEVEAEDNNTAVVPRSLIGDAIAKITQNDQDLYPGQRALQEEVMDIMTLLTPHLESDVREKVSAFESLRSGNSVPTLQTSASLSMLSPTTTTKRRSVLKMGMKEREANYINEQYRKYLEQTYRSRG